MIDPPGPESLPAKEVLRDIRSWSPDRAQVKLRTGPDRPGRDAPIRLSPDPAQRPHGFPAFDGTGRPHSMGFRALAAKGGAP